MWGGMDGVDRLFGAGLCEHSQRAIYLQLISLVPPRPAAQQGGPRVLPGPGDRAGGGGAREGRPAGQMGVWGLGRRVSAAFSIAFHWPFLDLSLTLHCLSIAFHWPFHDLSLTIHCLSVTFHWPFLDLSLTFHCLPSTFHCLSFASHRRWAQVLRGGRHGGGVRDDRRDSFRAARLQRIRRSRPQDDARGRRAGRAGAGRSV